ncbi:MAG: nitroreductase family protein [Syntrophorhabdaceae bacterium]|nr:nitroreductase family protein [Syntrophorhabdaceae bacterium]
MDLFTAMRTRRSCRDYLPDPVGDDVIEKVLEAATWAPSPANMQPWEFLVVTSSVMRGKIFDEAERCRVWAFEKSGWKWLDSYQVGFLKQTPVIIAVVGDPKKTGFDMFTEEGSMGYQAACAAAIQNMHLAACSLGLGSLWFTLFDKKAIREILGIDGAKMPLALICLGKCASPLREVPRKAVKDKTTYLR